MIEEYPVQVAGGREHEELWVPAEELEAFNARIVGKIDVVAAYQAGRQLDLARANRYLEN